MLAYRTGLVSALPGSHVLLEGVTMAPRLFDLNIEEVLDNWEVQHALREVIANALDEQVLSNTAEITIFRDRRGYWHIRDFGRGLRIEHFTLNENQEKLSARAVVIGKFGVGLKDALATFYRRGVDVYIRSQHGIYRLRTAQKHGFGGIVTLHVEYHDAPTGIIGTEFIFRGVTDVDMAKAKSLFLKFAGDELLETTAYGQVLRRRAGPGRVYILGVFASEEPNFLFSYNITSLTETLRKRLNRERLNVGRTTYANRVKSILRNSRTEAVHQMLVEQVRIRAAREQCDEMRWIEISQMALNLMHQRSSVVYVTEQEIQGRPDVLDTARSDGYEPVVVTEQQKTKLTQQMENGGPLVRTVEEYIREYNESFEYQFVDRHLLTGSERCMFDRTWDIFAVVGVGRRQAPEVRVSETIRVTEDDTGGVWDPSIPAIVIRRRELSSLVRYAATLLHELGHATSGARDATRRFEGILTRFLGQTATAAVGR